jgi:hypothetical protein
MNGSLKRPNSARYPSIADFEQGPIVVNIACSSSKSYVESGDELFGLMPAFLLAGQRAVIGTM